MAEERGRKEFEESREMRKMTTRRTSRKKGRQHCLVGLCHNASFYNTTKESLILHQHEKVISVRVTVLLSDLWFGVLWFLP